MVAKSKYLLALLTVLILLTGLNAHAQETLRSTSAIRVGDKIPEHFWMQEHIIYQNGRTTRQTFQKHRGKAMILDFWASWCGSCISGFPKLDSIAHNFNDKLQVVKVTYEQKELVQKVFHHDLVETGKASYEHSTIVADTYLRTLFPNRLLPHYVWINASGKVTAITTARDISKANIQLLLNGNADFLREKADQDVNKPLFISTDFLSKNELKSYSIFFKGMFDGLSQGVKNHLNEKGEVVGKTITNLPLVELYEAAAVSGLFNKLGKRYSAKLRCIEVEQSNLVMKDYNQPRNFSLSNYYSLSKRFETPVNGGLEELMLEELNRSSGYYGRLEPRKVSCLVLTTLLNGQHSNDQALQKENRQVIPKDASPKVQQFTINQLINRLNTLPQISPLVIDGTTHTDVINLTLPISTDLKSIREALRQQNLALIEETRELLVFVLGKHS